MKARQWTVATRQERESSATYIQHTDVLVAKDFEQVPDTAAARKQQKKENRLCSTLRKKTQTKVQS
jgi:hypothetical protein